MKRKTQLCPFTLKIGCVLTALAFQACGNAKTEDLPSAKPTGTNGSTLKAVEPPSPSSSAASPAFASPPASASPEPAVPPAKEEARTALTLKAQASSFSAKEGFPSNFDISIEILEGGKASGSATIGEEVLSLNGEAHDGAVRLWAQGDGKGTLRSGVFIGELAKQTASGKFALSGNGGIQSLQGTWKTL
jgi:hypothetical protein